MRPAAFAPIPPELPAELEPLEVGVLFHDSSHADGELSGAELGNRSARGVSFRRARLDHCALSGAGLDGLRLAAVELVSCDAANLRARRASLTRVAIRASRMTGVEFGEAELSDVTVQGCRVDLASFGAARLERVTFEDCLLAQTDFLDAQLESVRFHGCDLTGADFRGARLKLCEFRRCELAGLEGVENLRGAAMELPDIVGMASIWAGALGIGVLDED
ncbi:MAG: pentapeptide repeat-containing protein [Solirubrobacteraceae bacterium]